MSAAGRGPRGGGITDFFSTPAWCVHRLLDHLSDAEDHPLLVGRSWQDPHLWLEPGAGDGAIIRAVKDWRSVEGMGGWDFRRVSWVAAELREECEVPLLDIADRVLVGDLLEDDGEERIFNVAIGNPPFKHAFEFLEVCLRRARMVCFLLRLNFLEGQRRHPFLSRNVPDVFVLPERPSFDGQGTDATAYAWMVFDAERPKSVGTIRILDSTSEEERNRDRPTKAAASSHRWRPSGVSEDQDVCARCSSRRALSRVGPRWKYSTEDGSVWSAERPPCVRKELAGP